MVAVDHDYGYEHVARDQESGEAGEQAEDDQDAANKLCQCRYIA